MSIVNNFSIGQTIGIGNIQNYHEATAAQAKAAVSRLDGAELVEMYYQDGGDYRHAEKIYGVRNTASNEIVMGVSNRYEVVSHEDAFAPLFDAVDRVGLNPMVSLEDYGNAAQVYVLFPDLRVRDNADGVMMGVAFSNRYDRKRSFRGVGFGWRVRCLNGSTHGELFGELSVTARHTTAGVNSIPDQIEGFMSSILSRSYLLEDVIAEAANHDVRFVDYEEITNTIFPIAQTKRTTDEIARRIPTTATRWDVFCAITEVASHDDRLGFNVRDTLLERAERRVLMNRDFAPIPMPPPVLEVPA